MSVAVLNIKQIFKQLVEAKIFVLSVIAYFFSNTFNHVLIIYY